MKYLGNKRSVINMVFAMVFSMGEALAYTLVYVFDRHVEVLYFCAGARDETNFKT